MTIETWFPLVVYSADLTGAAPQKRGLIDAVYELEANGLVPRNFPEMAWTGDLHGVAQVHRDRRFAWVVEQVEIHTIAYLKALGIDLNQVDLYIQRAWPVVSRSGQAVGEHCHNTAHVSAVYYISVPNSGSDESGCLVFYDHARMNEVCPGLGSENTDIIAEWNPFNQDQAVYLPTEGRLLLFPAKQRHAVTMNHTEDDRLSVSFDIVLTAKPGQAAGSYEFLTPPPTQWQQFRSN
jgi:uncharacterized protein (TIGR02466 family)